MKDIKKTSNPIYREEYLKGYGFGLNPHFNLDTTLQTEAFYAGFDFGRAEYEGMNGLVSAGIPDIIVTKKTLDDFLLAGMLGLDIESDGYTTFQLDVIEIWYRNGIEHYDPNHAIYLRTVLEDAGIEDE